MRAIAAFAVLIVLGLGVPTPSSAQEEEDAPDTTEAMAEPAEEAARIYTTREERREAGLKHRITPWLTASDLVEAEAGNRWYGFEDPSLDGHDGEAFASIQLGLEITPWTWAKGEVIFELDHEFDGDSPTTTVDEAVAAFEFDDFELEAGKLYVSFGEYFSHFVSGPLLEFGETRGTGGSLSWAPDDHLDLSAFLYDGPADQADQGGRLDWGASAHVSPLEELTLGLSYLSDLADSQEDLLEDYGDRYAERVAALSGYAAVGMDRFEVTAEFVSALEPFAEFDPDRDQPRAWNVELAYFPPARFDAALRLEGSDEIADFPRLQGGAALSWRVARTASVTVEYLQGDFHPDLSEDPEGVETTRRLGAMLSVVF